MPKPFLYKEQRELEKQLIDTMEAGLKEWRPDLDYPESHSDLAACARGIIQMFELRRLPLPQKLKYECRLCDGTGYFSHMVEGTLHKDYCTKCNGNGWV